METRLPASRPVRLMGILNLTDDSFFPGSRMLHRTEDELIAQTEKMCAEADGLPFLLDLGACSTRPGSLGVGADEEWRRLHPALKTLRARFPELAISIDTYHPEVIRRACDAIGPVTVNDISADGLSTEWIRGDKPSDEPGEMLRLAGARGLPFIAMHMRGMPETMQEHCDYAPADDALPPVVQDVLRYFEAFSRRAKAAGVNDWMPDPGFGFSKTTGQNWALLDHLDALCAQGRPVLVGVSRKSMIYKPLGISPEEALPATQAVHMAALERGADLLRVHDVAEAARCVRLYRMLHGA